MSTLQVFTPTYRPVGGVVKILDYVTHARSLGYPVWVYCPERIDPTSQLFATDRFRALLEDPEVRFHRKQRMAVGEDDLFFVSLPNDFLVAFRRLLDGMSPERIIHVIQNVRHVNPAWRGGHGTRVLTRPAARISINQIVADVIEPWLDPRSLHRVVNIGHDVAFFARDRTGPLGRPLRVGYTTWKSDVGDRVASMTAAAPVEFRAVRDTATWAELRDLYTWADVFLSTPGPEEGMYLPGLEAMAAGCLVVTPDAGGNMAYCTPGENCLLVGFEDAAAYVDALTTIAALDAEAVGRLRASAYEMTTRFDLDAERAGFGDFLEELWGRIRLAEGGAS